MSKQNQTAIVPTSKASAFTVPKGGTQQGRINARQTISLLQQQFAAKSKEVTSSLCASVRGKGTSISGYLLDVKPSDKNSNLSVTIYIPSVSKVMVNPSEGWIEGTGSDAILHLFVMNKLPLLEKDKKANERRKWRYENSGKEILVKPNGKLAVSIYYANSNEEGYKELMSAVRMTPVTLVGVMPTHYERKKAAEVVVQQDVASALAVAPVAVADPGALQQVPQEAPVDTSPKEVLQDHPTLSIAYNADNAIIHNSTENLFLRLIKNCPPFPFYPVPKFETPIPAEHEVEAYLLKEYKGDPSKKDNARNRLWRDKMSERERQFYLSVLMLEVGHVRPGENERNQFPEGDECTERGISRSITTLDSVVFLNQKNVEEPQLVGLTTYFQWCKELEEIQAFYVSFHVRPDLIGGVLKVADVKTWKAIVPYHLPTLRITGWPDYADFTTRRPYVEGSDYDLGVKVVTNTVVSGLLEYIVTRGFEVTWPHAQAYIHAYYGIESADESDTEIQTETTKDIGDKQALLSNTHPDIINMIEQGINLQGGGGGFNQRSLLLNHLYCLPATTVTEEQHEIYRSWGDDKAKIISAILAGECSTPELKKYATQIGLTITKGMTQVFYLVKKNARTAYFETLASTQATRPRVPYLYENSPPPCGVEQGGAPSSDRVKSEKNESAPPIITPHPIVTPLPSSSSDSQLLAPPSEQPQHENNPVEELSTQAPPPTISDSNQQDLPQQSSESNDTDGINPIDAPNIVAPEDEPMADAPTATPHEDQPPESLPTPPAKTPKTQKPKDTTASTPKRETTPSPKKVVPPPKTSAPSKLGKRDASSAEGKASAPAPKKHAPSSQQ